MRIINLIICIASALSVSAQSWYPDILGDGYEACKIDLGKDYSGEIMTTLFSRKVINAGPETWRNEEYE